MNSEEIQNIVESMPQDEQSSLALGFYNFDRYMQKEMDRDYATFVPHGWSSPQPWGEYDVNSDYYDEFNHEDKIWDENAPTSQPYIVNVPSSGVIGGMPMSNFNTGDTSADSRESVNGAWGGLHDFGRTDNFVDDEYNHFLTKKARARRKLRKGGMSKKDALKQIPRTSLKTIAQNTLKGVGKGLKAVGNVVKGGVMFVPRQSYRLLLTLNFKGLSTRLAWIKKNDSSLWKKVEGKWKGIGGKVSSLEASINAGKGKKMLFCFRACKAKHNKKYVKKNFSGAAGIEIDKDALYADLNEMQGYSNLEPVSTATAAAMTAASSVIVMIGTQIGKAGETKAMKEETERQSKLDDEQVKLMAQQQGIDEEQMKRQLDMEENAIMAELDPINQIMQNPDLTPSEKAEAVKQVKEGLETKGKRDIKKYALIGGIALVAIVVLAKAFKK
jgi:hypothetical protein